MPIFPIGEPRAEILILFLSAVLLLSSLSGCGQTPASQTPPAEESKPPSGEQTGLLPSEEKAAAPLSITEVMPDNRNLVLGHEYDWVELYNPQELTVDLDGYALTDDLQIPDAFPLNGKQIPGGEYLTVVLEDTATFGLSEVGETVYLTYHGQIVSQLTFGAPQNGQSFDMEGVCPFPTPGYANTEEGYRSYQESLSLPELVINEVMVSNGAYLAVNYQYYDLVEVQNTSDSPLSLDGYQLTDKWSGTDRYCFPDITLAPGEVYVVFCSGNAALGQSHAPFALTPGDTVYLAKEGSYIDALPIPADLQHNESYGRSGNLPVYLNKPTPGSANTDGNLTGISAPTVDIAPGLYGEAVTVTLSGSGTIYYTTSGARPTTQSRVYTGPITIDNVTTLRAIAVEGNRKSPVANFTYVVGKEHDLPILVISTPESTIWGETGLYTNPKSSYEHEAVMTLFEEGEAQFTVPFGLCLHGNDSRLGSKKNFQLRFRGKYGASKLSYHLFENRDIDEFNSLLLKGGSEDWGTALIRDELATSLADGATTLYTQAMKPVVVYMAGHYWGVHFLRERYSADYVADHLDVSPESADIAYSNAGYATAGSSATYFAAVNYVKSHDMSTNESYAYLCQRIDVTSLIDWYVCRTYMQDRDLANIRRFRSVEDDGKWHWMYFDLDWSFYFLSRTPVSDILNIPGGDRTLILGVLDSAAGRDAFLKRYAYLMETVLNEEYINTRIDEIIAPILSEMPADRARWNRTMSGWEANVNKLRNFPKKQKDVVLRDIQNYFSLSDSQMEYYFGNVMD